MDQLNKNKYLNIIVIVLLIANLTTFGIFWTRQTLTKYDDRRELPRNDNNRIAVDFLSHELNFNDDQRNQFEQLKTEHRNSQEPVRRKIEKAKFDFFGLVKNDTINGLMINAAWDKVALLEKQMDVNTLNHFQLVRKICDSTQKIKFDSIIQNAIIQMRPAQQGPPPPRPNGPPDGSGRPPQRPGDSSRKGERPPPPEN